MSKIISEELKTKIRDFYMSKPMTLEAVAEKYNLCKPTIRKILGNIQLYSKTQIFNPKIREDFFYDINTEEKAYFLGLIIADGNIFNPSNSKHRGEKWVSITLDDADSYMLDNFRYYIGLSSKVASDGRGSSYVAARSDRMANDLEKYGVVPRKSFITRFPFEVSNKFYNHLIRGIIDGDGSIQAYNHYTAQDNRNRFKHSISCCGTHRLMQEMINVIKNNIKLNNDINVYDYKNKLLSEFKVTEKYDMFNFGNWIYKDATIYLSRKRDAFLRFIDHYKF